MYIDFHTHLDWYKDKNYLLQELISFKGIIITSSCSISSFNENLNLIKNFKTIQTPSKKPDIIATLGIHPQNTDTEIHNLYEYEKLLSKSPLIGETGMDFCWTKADRLNQEKCFRFFLEHCNSTGKICVIHTKGAEKQIAEILTEYPDAVPVIHWYDGPENIYREFISRGYYQTFGVETCRSKHIQSLLKITPAGLILAETDLPTSEPWLGGTDISPHLIKRVYKDIASILQIPEESASKIINNNSINLLKPFAQD